jgi:hypothetical protein
MSGFLFFSLFWNSPRIDEKPTLGLPHSSGNITSSNHGGTTTTSSFQDTSALSADAFDRLQKIKADRHELEEEDDHQVMGFPLQHSQTNLISIPLKTAQF